MLFPVLAKNKIAESEETSFKKFSLVEVEEKDGSQVITLNLKEMGSGADSELKAEDVKVRFDKDCLFIEIPGAQWRVR